MPDLPSVETGSNVTPEIILEVLRQFHLPNADADIVAAGQVKGLIVRDGTVGFALEVPPELGPTLEEFRQQVERAIQVVSGVTAVTVVLTAHRPGISHGQKSTKGPGPKIDLPNIGAVIAVASGKGGVGKSTTAVNLAVGLAQQGLRVGLLDADIYGPSVPRMLGLQGKPQLLANNKLQPMEKYGIKAMSIGFLVSETAATVWRGPMVMGALEQFLRDVDWGNLDVLVVDMPPGTGDAQLTMAQRVGLAGAVIVSTPQDIALIDAVKAVTMFRKVDVPLLGVVENMSYFECPHCHTHTHIFSHGGAREQAAKQGIPFLQEIPLDLQIRQMADAGTPIVIEMPDTPQARAYTELAAKISGRLQPLLTSGAIAGERGVK